ncbi:hypothetical protein I4F81_008782 [Pyropia yezoensis]|uniref:Uncharacterized protein n=1 Tax=Pyropia yezoensis TaxID=2788 RepID=A0ACC3C8X7_PYRYE|nr:hypothetical protein I4F81_008782 [Neopyropia yezoensis]
MLLGEDARLHQPVNVRNHKIVDCSVRHIALVTDFVRVVLGVVAGLRSARMVVGEGIHDVFLLELPKVESVLLRDAKAHSGLRLVDGTDPRRAEVHDEENVASMREDVEEGDGVSSIDEECDPLVPDLLA